MGIAPATSYDGFTNQCSLLLRDEALAKSGDIGSVSGTDVLDDLCIQYLCYMKVSINGVPKNRWFIRDTPSEMDDSGVPLF